MLGNKIAAGGALFCIGQRLRKGRKCHVSGIRRVEIDVAGFREGNVILDSGKSRPDQQCKGKIGVGRAVGAAQLESPVLTGGGGNANELGAVVARPGNVLRCFVRAKAAVGLLDGVEKQRHIRDLVQNAAHCPVHEIFRAALNGHIDVKSIAGVSLQGFGREVRVQPVPGSNGFDNGEEGNGIVRGGQGIGIAEIHLVLAGAFLVMGGFRLNAHPFQGQADFPADIFTLVLRRNVHIGSLIVGNVRYLAVFVQPE